MKKTANTVTRKCIKCNNKFTIYKSTYQKTKNSGLHCSNICRRKRINKECKNCKKIFYVTLSEARINFCSKDCYHNSRKVTKEHYLKRKRINRRNRVARINNKQGDFSINYYEWLCDNLKNICVLCNKKFLYKELTIDHMIAITKGGYNNNINIQPLCKKCNSIKGNRFNYCDERVLKLYYKYKKI